MTDVFEIVSRMFQFIIAIGSSGNKFAVGERPKRLRDCPVREECSSIARQHILHAKIAQIRFTKWFVRARWNKTEKFKC